MINAEDFTIDYFDFTITIIYFLKNKFSAIFYIANFEYSKKILLSRIYHKKQHLKYRLKNAD